MHERIYLDHAAITPVLGEARDAVVNALEHAGNPSSPHADGRLARAALEDARRTIAKMLNWRNDVILTSGGSEALAIAAARSPLPSRIVGATEHEAALAAMGEGALVIPVGPNGEIDLHSLKAALEEGPALVAIQLVNNETGVIQPLEAIYEIIKSAGSLLLRIAPRPPGRLSFPTRTSLRLRARSSEL